MTLVSIITPSLNQSAFLEQAMLSVLQQDHTDIEYIVVDGASTDGSREIIEKYADRLAWWVSEKDAGQAEAINKGLAHANGEIVAWLNSDDFYLPGAVRAAAAQFELVPGVDLVYGNMLAVDALGRTTNAFRYRQLSLEDLICFDIIGQPATFMRRRAVSEAGALNTNLRFLLDHELWIRLASRGRILHVDQDWAAARYHPAAKNRAAALEFGREAFRILQWVGVDRTLASRLSRVRRRARASAHRLDARYLLDGGQPRSALRAWLQSFALHPPTALARLNLLVSAVVEILGLRCLRAVILRQRQGRLSD